MVKNLQMSQVLGLAFTKTQQTKLGQADSTLICPSCHSPMILRQTTRIRYPKSDKPRLFYGCSAWPKCTEAIGAHPDGQPLGIPVRKAYRTLRHTLHVKLGENYKQWLVDNLEIPKARAHIGMLTEAEIDKAIVLLKE